jgi:hypothetical protein
MKKSRGFRDLARMTWVRHEDPGYFGPERPTFPIHIQQFAAVFTEIATGAERLSRVLHQARERRRLASISP